MKRDGNHVTEEGRQAGEGCEGRRRGETWEGKYMIRRKGKERREKGKGEKGETVWERRT